MESKKEKLIGLNEIREAAFGMYPNASKITIAIDGDKIKVSPIEDYAIPVGVSKDSEEE
ncbi:hypothetical protein [Paenibacillus illinoisensis]|uniref:Uncharacterized protein n=1 Tax=Paenibacillus illinoisensis TaxID=59845 RepID=A0A2W0CE09_9BACL|nr:hypothetical protein [Paenibacillus illinoisensis]PYY28342.1 Uncharacterized protein PIL02S_03493 [Paenibacillus illinoisensis]